MIDDSYVWKDRLRRERATLRRKFRRGLDDPAFYDSAFVAVEVFVFLTGYITRKLIEARKLSDELESASMEVTAYPSSGYNLDFMHADRIDRGYDLDAPVRKPLSLRDLCNLVIHSFVFLPATDEARTTCMGFFVNSERTKDKEVVFVSWDDFNVLVDEVVNDYVVFMHVDHINDRVEKSRVGEKDKKPTVVLNANVSVLPGPGAEPADR